MHRAIIYLLAKVLLLSACSEKLVNDELWIKPQSQSLGCMDYLSVVTPSGTLNNNVWNKHAAEGYAWQQCLEKRVSGDETQYGWSWQWPSHQKVIYGYPQIKLGSSPWAPELNSDKRFPVAINQIKNFKLSYDVEVSSNGQYNLATTLWITNSGEIPAEPAPSTIVAEVMIWTYATAKHFNPAGKKSGELHIEGMIWDVWVNKQWSDVSGVNKNTWRYITFRAQANLLAVEYDVKKLLDYAISEKLLTDDSYIADVELGNEVMSGSGVTWINAFNVVINDMAQ